MASSALAERVLSGADEAFVSGAVRARMERRKAQLEIKRELTYRGPDAERARSALVLLGGILGYESTPMHVQVVDHQNATAYGAAKRDRDLTLAFRGAGKTTWGTVIRAVKYVLEDPDVRILFASETEGASQAFLREVRAHLMENALLIDLFGRFFDPSARTEIGRYRDGYATVAQRRDRTLKEPTFLCLGVGGQAASRHFDVVFADDLVTLNSSRTAVQRRHLSDWHGSTLVGTFLPHTKVHYIGTRYYPRDLWEELADGKADEPGRGGSLAGAVLRLPMVTIDETTGEWTATCPERFTVETARARRREMGAYHFAAQMQQDTRTGEGVVFSLGDFEWWNPDDDGDALGPPEGVSYFQFSDLCAKKTETGDFFACVTVAVQKKGEGRPRRVWVVDAVRERAGMKRQRELVLACGARWRPVAAGIEAVQMQAGFAEEIRQMTRIPIVPVTVEKDKVFRARRVAPLVESHEVFFPVPTSAAGARVQMLVDELTMFPESDHDDLVDGFVGAITLAVYGGAKAAGGGGGPAERDAGRDSGGLRARY